MTAAPLTSEQTTGPAHTSILQKIFSFPAMLCALLAVVAVLTIRDRFDDPDMWWHLKTGEIIWTTHHIPTTDLFSFTTNHHFYIPHEWLSQLSMYAGYQLAGYSGVTLWLCIVTSALLIAGYILCWLYSGNAKVALVGALTIWFFGTIGFTPRPQMIGYLLLTFELIFLHLGWIRTGRWFFGLPPLFAVWVNCHASYYFGMLVAALVLVSSLVNLQTEAIGSVYRRPDRRRALCAALGLSVVGLMLNPVGIKLVLYPLRILFYSPVNLGAVGEWRALRITDPRGIGFLLVCACILILPRVTKSKLYLHEVLLLVASAFAGASHERLIFVFGIISAPVLCRLLAPSWAGYNSQQDHPFANAFLIAASLVTVYLAFPDPANLRAQIAGSSPEGAVQFVKEHKITGNLLNDYTFGGYLIWALPEHPVFVDGRTDIFEWTGVLREYGEWATLQSDPRSLPDKYHISFCILDRHSPMAFVLPLLDGWKTVYADDVAIVIARQTTGT